MGRIIEICAWADEHLAVPFYITLFIAPLAFWALGWEKPKPPTNPGEPPYYGPDDL